MAAALERLGNKVQADKRDRSGLVAAYAARRNKPIWMSPKGASKEALALAAEIRRADDWGLKASAFEVPKLVPVSSGAPDLTPEALADTEVRLSLAFLKYARHARGGRFEPTALTPFLDRKPPVYDPESLLEQVARAAEPAEYLRNLHPKHDQFKRLRERWLAARKSGASDAQRLHANMEQWRWMPEDLGSLYVWINVPEYLIRVVSKGKVIHTERVVVGKVDMQTPILTANMEQVIFHPFWGVPDSIKQHEILPALQKGSMSVLDKHQLRIKSGAKDIDPKSVDWSKTDIRRYHVYQAPGGGNVLGVVKFRFPNRHDVYLHDTPMKHLFKQATRTYSHGCMRVQDPVKLAEVILAEDRRMAPEKVRAMAAPGAPENASVSLSRRVPVHITYLTETIGDDGKAATFKDVYGHEERIRLALDGKMSQIKPVPPPNYNEPAQPVGRLAEIKDEPDWRRRAFGGGNIGGGN